MRNGCPGLKCAVEHVITESLMRPSKVISTSLQRGKCWRIALPNSSTCLGDRSVGVLHQYKRHETIQTEPMVCWLFAWARPSMYRNTVYQFADLPHLEKITESTTHSTKANMDMRERLSFFSLHSTSTHQRAPTSCSDQPELSFLRRAECFWQTQRIRLAQDWSSCQIYKY